MTARPPEAAGPAIVSESGEISYDLPVPAPCLPPAQDPAGVALGRTEVIEAAADQVAAADLDRLQNALDLR
jgi:hypothetical protein